MMSSIEPKKNPFEHNFFPFYEFLVPETDIMVQLLEPETDVLVQFLTPEIMIMGQRNFMNIIVPFCQAQPKLQVSLSHNHYFWLQKLNHNVSFWGQKFIKWWKIMFKWIFLGSIELIINPKHVQIIFFIFLLARILKRKKIEPEIEP